MPMPSLAAVGAALALAAVAAPPRATWFTGDFEAGTLEGFAGDFARPGSAVVVDAPVRRGRHALRIELAPGDRAASKERAELKLADKAIERLHAGPGGDVWYGWSFRLPSDYAPPPNDAFQILAQWHHRPEKDGRLGHGPPPLALHLACHEGRHVLVLILVSSAAAPPRTVFERVVTADAWHDVVVHAHWSRSDGLVEAYLDGAKVSEAVRGPTLFGELNNYLRLGLYRGKGVPSTNTIYVDEIRVGDAYEAVAPSSRAGAPPVAPSPRRRRRACL